MFKNQFCPKLIKKKLLLFIMSADKVAVTITGAAGRIAYALVPLILSGAVFGPTTKIDLRLLVSK